MPDDSSKSTKKNEIESSNDSVKRKRKGVSLVKEIGGRDGPDPTRFGDWEKDGRCIDF